MLQDINFRFRGGCMMLFRKEGEAVVFLGSAFLVHPDGYLVTVAHLLEKTENPMVVPVENFESFVPMKTETVSPIPASVVSMDHEHDVALVKFNPELEISMPDHVMGIPDEVPVGNSIACLGFSFGRHHIYNQIIKQGIVCSKILSRNDTRLFLFDSLTNYGMRGGPLVNVFDARVIGVVSGRFEPHEISGLPPSTVQPLASSGISYAVSIEYAKTLMENEGLTVF